MPDGQGFTPGKARRGTSTLPQATTSSRAPFPASAVPLAKRRGKKPRSTLPPLPPAVIREHGLEHRFGLGTVEVERDAPDPDNPARGISRARAVCSYRVMEQRRAITREQAIAADRYALLAEAEAGAKWSNGERVGSPADSRPWDREGATQTQVQAIMSLRAANAALGNAAKAIVALVAVGNLSVEALAVRLRRDKRVVMGELSAALTRLVEHFEETDAKPERRRHTIRD